MKKSYLDWENRLIVGRTGQKYKISPETISFGRWPLYELWSTLITVGMDNITFTEKINECRKLAHNIKVSGDLIKLANNLDDFGDRINRQQELGRNQLTEFFSIFCIKIDDNGNIIEDVGDLKEDLIREKYNDWKEIDSRDFFLLLPKVVPLSTQS